MDGLLSDGRIASTERHCMKKVSRDNMWVEADWEDTRGLDCKYPPFAHGNGLVIGTIKRTGGPV